MPELNRLLERWNEIFQHQATYGEPQPMVDTRLNGLLRLLEIFQYLLDTGEAFHAGKQKYLIYYSVNSYLPCRLEHRR